MSATDLTRARHMFDRACDDAMRGYERRATSAEAQVAVLTIENEGLKAKLAAQADKLAKGPLGTALFVLQTRLEQVASENAKMRRDEPYASMQRECVTLREALAAAKKETAHWKANHDNQVKVNRALRDRPDLGDRAKSVLSLQHRLHQLLTFANAVTAHEVTDLVRQRLLEGLKLTLVSNLKPGDAEVLAHRAAIEVRSWLAETLEAIAQADPEEKS